MMCKIEGCGKPARVRGWCAAHYYRWKKHGHPLGGGTSPGEPERFFRDVVMAYEGNDCIEWPFMCTGAGYAQITVEGQSVYVSRLICEEHRGPAPTSKHQAAHSCGRGDKGCVTKRHLDWKTPAGNQADRIVHGTHNRGERQGGSKLTESQVRQIRKLEGSMLQREIAERFGVSKGTIQNILARTTWGWL